ncbi:MAG: hypothetical protein DLM54_11645 [Acidimicrobiales bacterium]|nr:MAG: hypothetical protein DLM54_11645 [Acidimicrobiales bacterium]
MPGPAARRGAGHRFPLLLGTLADHVGLSTAFAVEPVLLIISAVLLLAGTRASRTIRARPA